jgi:Domain of unknown function (DUF4386)
MTSLSLKSHDIGYGIGLLLVGPFFLVAGYQIFRSTYFPRAIGILYQIGGVAYMVNGFVLILAPSLRSSDVRRHRASVLRWGGIICLWLLIRGVKVRKWNESIGIFPSNRILSTDPVPH